MQLEAPSSLRMPSFLHGPIAAVQRKTRTEGRRCAEQYRRDGSFPAPRELLEVPPGEVVLTHELADVQRERSAWRLYLVASVMGALGDALNWEDTVRFRAAYEAFFRETAWGALYFAVSQTGTMSAQRVALRLHAVLRFWEALQSARYLFKKLEAVLTLEELMVASSDWAMEAWCPVGEGSVRQRLELAAERMAHATWEDCIEAIVRQMPRALEAARDLKHRDVLANPALLRQHLATLDPVSFERMSAACTSDLLEHLYEWDHQLGMH